mmetsp:Transcript_32582/g.77283  ORF Transcript_32582/g.77283 Transcript_32582/m.77283 type:complete len:211 (+) Transcript_32582:2207-2839(+)
MPRHVCVIPLHAPELRGMRAVPRLLRHRRGRVLHQRGLHDLLCHQGHRRQLDIPKGVHLVRDDHRNRLVWQGRPLVEHPAGQNALLLSEGEHVLRHLLAGSSRGGSIDYHGLLHRKRRAVVRRDALWDVRTGLAHASYCARFHVVRLLHHMRVGDSLLLLLLLLHLQVAHLADVCCKGHAGVRGGGLDLLGNPRLGAAQDVHRVLHMLVD